MSRWQPIGPDHPLNGPGPHIADLTTPSGAHLPTLEVIRALVQERVKVGSREMSRNMANGIHSQYGEGYLAAMHHVLDMLEVIRQRGDAQ